MVQYSVRQTELFDEDVLGIYRYIALELKEPAIALRMVGIIDQSIKTLTSMPQRCPLVDDERLAALGYRMLVIKNYLAFFTIDEEMKVVIIERILYMRRDWLNIL